MSTFLGILAAGRDRVHSRFAERSYLTRELLTSVGFTDVRLRGESSPMYFGRDVEDVAEFIAGQFSWLLRRGLSVILWADMASHLRDGCVYYDSSAWLIEAEC